MERIDHVMGYQPPPSTLTRIQFQSNGHEHRHSSYSEPPIQKPKGYGKRKQSIIGEDINCIKRIRNEKMMIRQTVKCGERIEGKQMLKSKGNEVELVEVKSVHC